MANKKRIFQEKVLDTWGNLYSSTMAIPKAAINRTSRVSNWGCDHGKPRLFKVPTNFLAFFYFAEHPCNVSTSVCWEPCTAPGLGFATVLSIGHRSHPARSARPGCRVSLRIYCCFDIATGICVRRALQPRRRRAYNLLIKAPVEAVSH